MHMAYPKSIFMATRINVRRVDDDDVRQKVVRTKILDMFLAPRNACFAVTFVHVLKM
jgi:hypothetical protein